MACSPRSARAGAAALPLLVLALTAQASVPLFLQPNASAPAAIAVEIVPDAVRATNVTPGGDLLWFGRSVEYEYGIPRLSRHLTVMADDDGDGVVRWEVVVPHLSVWTAVDLKTGAFAAGGPAGFGLELMTLPKGAWRGGVAHVDLRRDLVDVVLVRPHVGIWTLRAFEGGSHDADGISNATLRASLNRMRPMTGSPPAPPTATPHDVLIVIDPRALDVFANSAD